MIEMKIKGTEQVARALEDLEVGVRKRVLVRSVRRRARPIVKGMRARLRKHRRFGLLSKSIGVRVKVYPRSGTVFAAVGVRSGFADNFILPGGGRAFINPRNYAHLLEFGVRAHSVKPKDRIDRGATPSRGGRLGKQTGPSTHPGFRAFPFMRPTYDSLKRPTLRLMIQDIWEGIKREADKARAKNRAR